MYGNGNEALFLYENAFYTWLCSFQAYAVTFCKNEKINTFASFSCLTQYVKWFCKYTLDLNHVESVFSFLKFSVMFKNAFSVRNVYTLQYYIVLL